MKKHSKMAKKARNRPRSVEKRFFTPKLHLDPIWNRFRSYKLQKIKILCPPPIFRRFGTRLFNPRTRNSIPCRIFEKTHLRMDLSQGTSKHGFEAKITFVSSFFQKRNIARSIFSLMNRYWKFTKKLCCFTTCWGDFLFNFLRFSRISRVKEKFLCKN